VDVPAAAAPTTAVATTVATTVTTAANAAQTHFRGGALELAQLGGVRSQPREALLHDAPRRAATATATATAIHERARHHPRRRRPLTIVLAVHALDARRRLPQRGRVLAARRLHDDGAEALLRRSTAAPALRRQAQRLVQPPPLRLLAPAAQRLQRAQVVLHGALAPSPDCFSVPLDPNCVDVR